MFKKELYKRLNSLRLKGWDYRLEGYYFITICTKDGEYYFGNIIDNKMRLSKIGFLAKKYWREIPKHFPYIKLDAFIIMPNHIHGILMMRKNGILEELEILCNKFKFSHHQNSTDRKYPKSGSISTIIRSYKSICTKQINRNYKNIYFIWHRNFYDHIIRTQKDLWNIREYIKNNPSNWERDRNFKK